MSGIARQMFSLSTVLNTVSGALFGSGSLSIPIGATLVTMTGQGGTGGDNSYYIPEQPYIPPASQVGLPEYPSGLPAYSPASPARWTGGSYSVDTYTIGGSSTTSSGAPGFTSGSGLSEGTANGATKSASEELVYESGGVIYYASVSTNYIYSGATYLSATSQVGLPEYPSGLPAYSPATEGQAYVPASSGGGPYYGTNTTATLNGVTRTWVGGYATVGTPSVQTLSSTGAGQTLTYSVGSGGYINYSYTY